MIQILRWLSLFLLLFLFCLGIFDEFFISRFGKDNASLMVFVSMFSLVVIESIFRARTDLLGDSSPP